MNQHRKYLTAFLACAICTPAAHAAIILNDNFDSYANQAAFEAAWTPIGSDITAPSGLLSNAQSVSSPNSVRVPGTAANNQYRNQRIFSETNTFSSQGNMGIGDRLIWSFDFYDSAPAGAPQRNFVNLQDTTAPGGTNQLISLGLNNNQTAANSGGNFYMARILGYNPTAVPDPDGGPAESVGGSGAYFKLNDFGVGLRSLGWQNLKVVLNTHDGVATNYAFYVNNQLAERVTVTTAGTLRSYDNIRIGSGLSNGSVEAFFDNMYLEYIARSYQVYLGNPVDNVLLSSGDSLDFGTHFENDPDPTITLTIVNNATAALALTGLTVNSPFSALGPASINADGSASVTLSLSTATKGTFAEALSFSTNWGGQGTANFSLNLTGHVIPEPTSAVLLGLGLIGCVAGSRRRWA